MGKSIDRVGLRYGILSVLKLEAPRIGDKSLDRRWKCQCDCGNTKVIRGNSLQGGRTKSCGCGGYKPSEKQHESSTREYRIWTSMKRRCFKETCHAYSYYGGRGISVCDRWRYSYLSFLDDMGRAPSTKYSLDRIDNNGNYEPDNCRWATMKEQSNNTRKTVLYKFGDREDTISGWAEVFGMKYSALYTQLVRFGRDISDVAFKIDYKLAT